ncbi:hypothetical protein H6G36_25475 [Anabaena minutissima FACHB-250]|nr:hypothetical protein [Anabaena minutissima FACHB-250]
MLPVYAIDTLKVKGLAELKAIATQLGVVAQDKRSKQSWIDAIVDYQQSKVQKISIPTKESPLTVEEAAQSNYTFSYAGIGNFLVIKGYNDKNMVVVNDGYDDLTFSAERIELMTYGLVVGRQDVTTVKPESVEPAKINSETVPVAVQGIKTCATCSHFKAHNDGTNKGWCCLFDSFARESHAVTQDCINSSEEEQVDDYLFHDDEPQPQQPANLPVVGESHYIGDFTLTCSEVAGKYTAAWEVRQGKQVLGDIRMLWNTFWEHTYSGEKLFTTPQLAVIGLAELTQKQKEQPVTSQFVRRFSKSWLQTQECTIVGYWGAEKIDLWEVVDIYVQAKSENDSVEDAFYSNFPDIADDLQVTTTTNSEFSFIQMMRDFEGCQQVKAFLRGEVVECETEPANLVY